MTMRDITPGEWKEIRKLRGEKATGCPAHDYVYDATDYVYFWPFGEQPSLAVKCRLMNKCPTKAAENFLKLYRRNDSTPGHQKLPIARDDAPALMRVAVASPYA